ncbi:MAG: hypothetical protein D6748_14395 [Calditrichaeota bacterium]|nr:MAG: hypothetical protein D6748_14395 [Calditrichota bacterium]
MKLRISSLMLIFGFTTCLYSEEFNIVDSTQIRLIILDSIGSPVKDGLLLELEFQNLTQDTIDLPIDNDLFQLGSCTTTKLDTFKHIPIIDTPLYFFNDLEANRSKITMKVLPLQKFLLQVFFKKIKRLPPQGLYCRVTYIFRLKVSEEYFQSYRIVSSNKVYVMEP